jgi:hypothetical protein
MIADRLTYSQKVRNQLQVSSLSDEPYNQKYNNSIKALLNARNDEISYLNNARAKIAQSISELNSVKANLQQYRTQINNTFMSRAESVSVGQKLMPLYDELDPYMKSLNEFSDGYKEYTSNNDELFNDTIDRLSAQNQADLNYIESQRRAALNSAPSINQVTLPKIEIPQLPKTTYCTSSYTGIQGRYEISCTERTF